MSRHPEAIAELPPIEDLSGMLAEAGYCWLRRNWTYEAFHDYCAGLGEIFYEADIKMGATRPRNYQLPAAIGFHTDHVSAHTVAWYCIRPDSDGGAMWLLDLKPAVDQLADDDQQALTRVRVPDNAVWSKGGDLPLRERNNGHDKLHYVPWLDLKAPDDGARTALRRLQSNIAEAEKSDVIVLDVAPGDAVIVDNHRVMHGRAAIRPASDRYLKRLWIRDHES